MDLKFALRSLLKNPGFTLLATLVMALGIGANTAVFSVVNTVLLKPLAYRDPDSIVTIRHLWRNTGRIGNNVSAPDYHDIHDQNTSFAATAYITGEGGITGVQIDGSAEYVQAAGVSPEFFQVFQLEPFMGRFFTPEEQAMNSGGAALLSYAYWQQRFGGNRSALGRAIRVGDKTLPIVGIAPPGFDYPKKCQIWFPSNAVYPENRSRSSHNHRVIARLKPAVPLDQARAQMTSLAANLEKLYPPSNQGKGITVDRMQDTLVSNVRLTFYVLLGAVAVVLLIACANMANLLLAKATSRNREMAIRAAVGASRARIIRQLIVESVVLAAVSGTAGLILAIWGADVLVSLAPANVPRLAETHTDGWVLAFTSAVSLLSSLLFGLAPALQASKVDLNDALK